jgi:hypothetical protein
MKSFKTLNTMAKDQNESFEAKYALKYLKYEKS